MNKFKLGDLPIGMKNKVDLAFKGRDTFRVALNYFSPEITNMAEFKPEFITCKTDIWLVRHKRDDELIYVFVLINFV